MLQLNHPISYLHFSKYVSIHDTLVLSIKEMMQYIFYFYFTFIYYHLELVELHIHIGKMINVAFILSANADTFKKR